MTKRPFETYWRRVIAAELITLWRAESEAQDWEAADVLEEAIKLVNVKANK